MDTWLIVLIMCAITSLATGATSYYHGYRDGAHDTAREHNKRHGLTP